METIQDVKTTDIKIIIDEEFRHLMPPLGGEAYSALEAGLIKDGCLSPIVLWEGILVDGHNRYEICTKHNIPFETVNIEFSTRDEAIVWIIEMQSGRRNLTPSQVFYYRGLHYRTARKIVWDRVLPDKNTGKTKENDEGSENQTLRKNPDTGSTLAGKYYVSRDTIMRDSKASEGIDAIGEVSADAKQKILTHEVQIGKSTLEKLAAAPKEEIAQIAKDIEEGTYSRNGSVISADDGALPPDSPGSRVAEGRKPYVSDALISMINSNFNTLQNALESGTAASIRKAARDCINTLENLYAQL